MAWENTCIECGRPIKYGWGYCSRGCVRNAKNAGDYQESHGCLTYLGIGFLLLCFWSWSSGDKIKASQTVSVPVIAQEAKKYNEPKILADEKPSYKTGFYKLPKPEHIKIDNRPYRLISVKSDDGENYELVTSTERLFLKRSDLPSDFFDKIK
jgi:hypothetical protein